MCEAGGLTGKGRREGDENPRPEGGQSLPTADTREEEGQTIMKATSCPMNRTASET